MESCGPNHPASPTALHLVEFTHIIHSGRFTGTTNDAHMECVVCSMLLETITNQNSVKNERRLKLVKSDGANAAAGHKYILWSTINTHTRTHTTRLCVRVYLRKSTKKYMFEWVAACGERLACGTPTPNVPGNAWRIVRRRWGGGREGGAQKM